MKTLSSALAHAYDKGLSLSTNYPNGFGDLFIEWIMDKHPAYVLYHVERVRGSRQDMILEASLTINMNREVNIELLDESLIIPGKRRDNILICYWHHHKWQRNIAFYALSIFNMHSHSSVSREDTRAQGISCWGSSRRAMVHTVDGKSPGHSP